MRHIVNKNENDKKQRCLQTTYTHLIGPAYNYPYTWPYIFLKSIVAQANLIRIISWTLWTGISHIIEEDDEMDDKAK